MRSQIRYWLGAAGSASLLALATRAWADLFVFGNSISLPPLAFDLPFPLLLPSCIAALCLVPAAALPAGLRASAAAVAGATALGSLGAVTAYWAQWANGSYLIANALFTYAYIVLRFCLPAGILLLTLRSLPVLASHVRRRPPG